jgi:hypothetical protein
MPRGILSIPKLNKSNSNSSPSQVAIIFWQKQKKSSPIVPHLRLPFIPMWAKPTSHAHIYAQQSAVHPPILEEVEEYKNNLFFLKILDLSFQEVEVCKHNFVSLSGFLM